jgi:hypothetical protein
LQDKDTGKPRSAPKVTANTLYTVRSSGFPDARPQAAAYAAADPASYQDQAAYASQEYAAPSGNMSPLSPVSPPSLARSHHDVLFLDGMPPPSLQVQTRLVEREKERELPCGSWWHPNARLGLTQWRVFAAPTGGGGGGGAKSPKDELWSSVLEQPQLWWDNRLNKKNPKAPDFKQKDGGYEAEALWYAHYPHV